MEDCNNCNGEPKILLTSKDNKPYYTSHKYKSNSTYNTKNCKCGKNSSLGCKCNKGPQGCNVITLQDALDLLARINYKIAALSEKVINNLTIKTPITISEDDSLRKLLIYKRSILRYTNKLVRGESLKRDCVCPKTIQMIFENAKQQLGIGYSPERSLHYAINTNVPELEDGLYIDESKFNSWIAKNPYCAPVDSWEKLAYFVCGKLDMTIEVEEIKCNLTFEIIRETIPLNTLAGLSIGNLTKKNGYSNKRSNDECKLDWEILVEEENKCDLSYDVYLQLVRNCNLTYDVVREAYGCGLSFKVTNGKYQLVGKNSSYDLSEIEFNSPITSLSQLNLNQKDLTSGNSLDKNKINSLLADYNLTEKQLRKLK